MSESRSSAAQAGAARVDDEVAAAVAALRARGAARFDAVGLRVIELMLRRAQDCQGATRAVLVRKLTRRLAAFRERFEVAASAANTLRKREALRFPAAADALRTAWEAGDYRALQGLVARLHRGTDTEPLAGLLAHLACHAGAVEAAVSTAPTSARGAPRYQLKALSHFRHSWSRLSLEQQLSRALAQAPENAGPLNSHYLVLQALIRMRDLAPAYLESFMLYADALQWLEQAEPGRASARGAGQKGRSQKETAQNELAQKGKARKAARRTLKPSRSAPA